MIIPPTPEDIFWAHFSLAAVIAAVIVATVQAIRNMTRPEKTEDEE